MATQPDIPNPYRTAECVNLYGPNQSARETHAADFDRTYAKLSANFDRLFAEAEGAVAAYRATFAVVDARKAA